MNNTTQKELDEYAAELEYSRLLDLLQHEYGEDFRTWPEPEYSELCDLHLLAFGVEMQPTYTTVAAQETENEKRLRNVTALYDGILSATVEHFGAAPENWPLPVRDHLSRLDEMESQIRREMENSNPAEDYETYVTLARKTHGDDWWTWPQDIIAEAERLADAAGLSFTPPCGGQ